MTVKATTRGEEGDSGGGSGNSRKIALNAKTKTLLTLNWQDMGLG